MDLSKEIIKGRNSKQQQQTVSGVLGSLLPPEASERFRKWFPVSKVSYPPACLSMHAWLPSRALNLPWCSCLLAVAITRNLESGLFCFA